MPANEAFSDHANALIGVCHAPATGGSLACGTSGSVALTGFRHAKDTSEDSASCHDEVPSDHVVLCHADDA